MDSFFYRLSALFIVGCIITASYSATQIPILDWPGKRSDWVNVKTDVTPAAKGDGITDDAPAIQAALSGSGYTIYFPPGTYRITTTLTTKSGYSQWFVGHGRTTVILWDGATGTSNRMMVAEGTGTSYWLGLTFDGNAKAGVGLDHDSKSLFETESNHRHCAFKNLTSTGLRVGGGQQIQASAEMTIINCLFDNCREGAAFYMANDYDETIDGCEFRNCGTGVTAGQGNFYVRNCHFENTTGNDINTQGAMHPCSIIRCTSVNSNKFINTNSSNSSIFIQDCQVSGWKSTTGAITHVGSPAVIFDCVFTNPPSATAIPFNSSAMVVSSQNVCAAVTRVIGPTTQITTIPAGIRLGSLTSATQSFLTNVVSVPQKVYDVKTFGAQGNGSADDRVAIQTAIDSARNYGNGAIAYLPRGTYKVTSSLMVYGANYIVGGAGFNSQIIYRGATGGVTMRVISPENVIIQQLGIGNEDKAGTNTTDILQTSTAGTSGSSSVLYDIVHVYGKYTGDPFVKGLQISGVRQGANVVAAHCRLSIYR